DRGFADAARAARDQRHLAFEPSHASSALCEPHGARHDLEMVRLVSEVEAGREDALVEEMQRMLLAEADGAQELVRLARHRLCRPARVGLRHRDVSRARMALVAPPRRVMGEPTRRLHVAQEIGARVLYGLERAQRPPELLAALGVLDTDIQDV